MHRAPNPPIPVPHGAHSGHCLPLASLRFGPLGLYYWRIWQGFFPEGGPNYFVNNIHRFRALDIAFFAAGMAYDGLHNHPQNQFHPLMKALVLDTKETDASCSERKELIVEVLRLLLDIVRGYRSPSSLPDHVDKGGLPRPYFRWDHHGPSLVWYNCTWRSSSP